MSPLRTKVVKKARRYITTDSIRRDVMGHGMRLRFTLSCPPADGPFVSLPVACSTYHATKHARKILQQSDHRKRNEAKTARGQEQAPCPQSTATGRGPTQTTHGRALSKERSHAPARSTMQLHSRTTLNPVTAATLPTKHGDRSYSRTANQKQAA